MKCHQAAFEIIPLLDSLEDFLASMAIILFSFSRGRNFFERMQGTIINSVHDMAFNAK